MAIQPQGNVQGPGEVKDTIGRLSPKGRAVFTTKGWNDALRQAGEAAIGWWLVNYGKLRFDARYALQNLPYHPGKGKMRRINKWGEPSFYSEGVLQNNLYMRSKLDVRAKKGGITSMKLRVPIGHFIKEDTIKAFKYIPDREHRAVAREFRRALEAALQAGAAKAAAKARAKAERQARAAANKAKREAGRQRAAANRAARERALAASARGRARMEERRAKRAADHAARRRAANASARSADRRKSRAEARRQDRLIRQNERARLDPSYE